MTIDDHSKLDGRRHPRVVKTNSQKIGKLLMHQDSDLDKHKTSVLYGLDDTFQNRKNIKNISAAEGFNVMSVVGELGHLCCSSLLTLIAKVVSELRKGALQLPIIPKRTVVTQ